MVSQLRPNERPANLPQPLPAPGEATRPGVAPVAREDGFEASPAPSSKARAPGGEVPQGLAPFADSAALWGVAAPAAGATYTVQPGDTLYGIASKLGVAYAALLEANPQLTDPNLIEVGQTLQTPGEGGVGPQEPVDPAEPLDPGGTGSAIPVAPQLQAAHTRFAAQLGAPTGEPVLEPNGNLKQDFERGYLLRGPDGTTWARALDNTELGRVDPVKPPPPPAGVDADALQWVNKTRPVSPQGYAPHDLVSVDANGNLAPGSRFQVRALIQEPLRQMIAAAAAEGLNLDVISAYRSFGTQQQVYGHWVEQLGQAQADRVSARPGHSEHQLGTTVDLNILDASFGQTPEGRWLAAEGPAFGFEISYPHGHEQTTGYTYEPWHGRFVGTEIASEIHGTGETLEEYFGRTRS